MKRRWFRLHLSTAVLLSLTAGALMWKNISAEPSPQPGSTSEWVSSDGLGIRLSIKNAVVTAKSPAEFTIELRNDSQEPLVVFAERNLWEHVTIETLAGERVQNETTKIICPAIPSLDWFVLLKPKDTIEHSMNLPLELSAQLPVLREYAFDHVVGKGAYQARASYHMPDLDQARDKNLAWVETGKALGGRLWKGSITSAAIPIVVHPPWSRNQIITHVSIALAILVLVAISSEWLIRRRNE